MSDLAGWIDALAEAFTHAREDGAIYSILIGWIIAIGVTQWVKNLPAYPTNKHWIRACAAPIGALVTFLLWPDKTWNAMRVLTSAAAGLASPWVYWLITRAIYKFWPGAEAHLSANPPADT